MAAPHIAPPGGQKSADKKDGLGSTQKERRAYNVMKTLPEGTADIRKTAAGEPEHPGRIRNILE